MNKKRFTVEPTMMRECILDNETGEQLDTFDYTERLCELLNEFEIKCYNLEKENENLESNVRFFKNQFDKLKEISKDKEQDVLHLYKKNEQLKQELQGMEELLKSYRETIKHDAELLADATRNGYLPPLDDFVKG